ncbi:MAG: RDD family protein [Candidatus Planktophila sp.]|nr:RDD family protein [Candidatus Planktophila sp.]
MNRKIIRDDEETPVKTASVFSKSEPRTTNSQSPRSEVHTSLFDRGSAKNSRVEKYGQLATPQSRLIAFLIDAAIFGFGLGIVWIIWFITLAEKGTTPGHYLMGQVIVDSQSGEVFGWKKMVVREVLIKGLMHWILGGFLFMVNYIIDASFIFTSSQKTLHDLMIGSQVIQCSDKTIIKKLKVAEMDSWLNK